MGSKLILGTKTFKGRLPDLMDQAQHFTGTASAAARSGGDEVGAEFRSGLDAAERECEYGPCVSRL